ncbi:MAG: hypothetical protein R2873_19080 [Caldilineaceae bacterium]
MTRSAPSPAAAYGNVQLYQQLCTYNNIADCNRIEIGDEIQVPVQSELGGSAPAATPAATAAATPTPAPTTAAAEEEATPAATAEPAEEDDTTGSTPVNEGATGDLVAKQPVASASSTHWACC